MVVPAAAVGAAGIPVNVGETIGAFKSSAVCCAVEIGLLASLVLSTFPKPTFDALIPVAILALVTLPSKIFVVVTLPSAIIGKAAVPVRSPANCTLPFSEVVASGVVTVVIAPATNAVVAICVVVVPAAAVGAAGIPVNVGLLNIVALLSLVTLPKLTSDAVTTTSVDKV